MKPDRHCNDMTGGGGGGGRPAGGVWGWTKGGHKLMAAPGEAFISNPIISHCIQFWVHLDDHDFSM